MQLNKIDDPRDKLAKARRSELVRYARANGIQTFEFMGQTFNPSFADAEITRAYLRSVGLRNPPIPNRALGQINQPHGNAKESASSAPIPPTNGVEVSALAHLVQQSKRPDPVVEPPSLNQMGINELRSLGKSLGIKFTRKDNMPTMRDKIEAKRGENAA